VSANSTNRFPSWVTMARDVISYLGGWGLIIHQALFVPPGTVNEWFLLLGGSLIGVPGIGEILALRARAQGGTDASPSQPPAPESSVRQ